MLAHDPLSLVFLGCVLFAGTFLLIASVGGLGHGHLLHLGHAGQVGHVGHVGHVSHVGHVGHATPGHATPGHAGHTAPQPSGNGAGQSPPAAPLATTWDSLTGTLLSGLNLYSVLAFLFFFGLLGYLLHNATSAGVVLTILLPALFGAAAALAVGSAISRLFASQAGVLTLEDSRLEGRVGTVSLAIRPGGVGEVIFRSASGGSQSIGARASDGEAIPVGAEIVIVGVHDGIAGVQTWDAFMRGARSGQERLAGLDEAPELRDPTSGPPP
jgi:hypothetical protein